MRCLRAELLLLVAAGVPACLPPPPLPPPVLSNHSSAPAPVLAMRASTWIGEDDTHWTYELRIEGDRFRQLVHQAGGETCVQAGTIEQKATELVRTFDKNDCNNVYVGKAVHDTIVSRTEEHLVLRMEGDYLIRYDRAP